MSVCFGDNSRNISFVLLKIVSFPICNLMIYKILAQMVGKIGFKPRGQSHVPIGVERVSGPMISRMIPSEKRVYLDQYREVSNILS